MTTTTTVTEGASVKISKETHRRPGASPKPPHSSEANNKSISVHVELVNGASEERMSTSQIVEVDVVTTPFVQEEEGAEGDESSALLAGEKDLCTAKNGGKAE